MLMFKKSQQFLCSIVNENFYLGYTVNPGQKFSKIWTVVNNGSQDWLPTTLLLTDKSQFSPKVTVVGEVATKQTK